MSAAESYKVAASLGLNIRDTLGPLAEVIKMYRSVLDIQRQIKSAQDSISSALRTSATAAKNLANEMERAARASQAMAGQAAAAASSTAQAARAARDAGVSGASGQAQNSAAPAAPGMSLVPSPRLLPPPINGAVVPAPRLLPPPNYGFTTQGSPYDQPHLGLPAPEPQPPLALSAPALRLAAPYREFTTQGDSYGPGTSMVPAGGRYTRSEYMGSRPPDGSTVMPYAGGGGLGYRGGTMGGGGGGSGEGGDAPYFDDGERGPVPLFGKGNRSDYYALAWGAQSAGRASSGLVDGSFMAAAGADQLKGALRTQGFTPDQADKAFDAALKTQHDVAGAYVGQNLEVVAMLMKQTQKADEAIALLPDSARAQAVFKGLGRGDGMQDIGDLLNSAELRGTILKPGKDGKEHLDLPAFQKFAKNIETITAMSGGQIGPSQMYQFIRSAGVSGKMISDEHGFAEDMPFIQSMGAAQAGQALQGFGQQFSGGKMSQAAINLMAQMGIIGDKSKVMKAGMGNYLLMPGAMKLGDVNESREHPAEFILNRLLPAVDKWLAENYKGDFTNADPDKRRNMETGALQTVASRITGGKFMAQAVTLSPYIDRDILAQQKLASNDPYKTAVESNPLMALQSYKAALDALMITFGNDNMKLSLATMKALTTALNAMTDVFKSDPQLGAQLMLVADALKVLAPVITTLAIAAPAFMALKTLVPGLSALRFGPGGALVATAASLAMNNLDKVPRTKDDIASGNWRDIGTMLWEGVKTVMHSSPQQRAADAITVVVNSYLDGTKVASKTVTEITKSASGPNTGTVDFDSRRSAPPVDH